jgi:hypothetical protein
MNAVAALYATDQYELAQAIVVSLSHAIFNDNDTKPASRSKVLIGHISHKVVQWTTRSSESKDNSGANITLFSNRLMERSGHPYAQALLTSTHSDCALLVEGGDPMNGPYMMLSPEIRRNGGLWDRIFFDSVQSKDVQMRFIHETLATYQAARVLLEHGESVRIKAVAAGTGLSLVLVYDKLIRDGFDPKLITAVITDRSSANTEKTQRLLAKLPSTQSNLNIVGHTYGIFAISEDVFDGPDPLVRSLHVPYNIVTAIGILEYFQGVSNGTTEQRLLLDEPSEPFSATDLAASLGGMISPGGCLIINTYRDHPSIRILELFGKRFDFRDRNSLRELLAASNFRPLHLAGSGNIYDVEVFERVSLP